MFRPWGVSFLVVAMVFLGRCDLVAAQDFFSPLGTTILDTKQDLELAPTAKATESVKEAESDLDAFMLYRELPPAEQQAAKKPPEPFLKTVTTIASYGYTFRHSKLSDDTNTRTHGTTPKIYLESFRGLSVSPSVTYANSVGRDALQTKSETDTFGFALSLGQNLTTLFAAHGKEKGATAAPSPRWELTAAADAGYRNSSKSIRPLIGAHSSSDQDAWSAGGGLGILWHVRRADHADDPDPAKQSDRTGKLDSALTPSIRYDSKKNFAQGATTSTVKSTLFALQERIDYVVARQLTLTGTISWYHDIDQNLSSGPKPVNQDWAEFGLQASAILSAAWRAKASGSYEAFNSNYYTYKFGIELQRSF